MANSLQIKKIHESDLFLNEFDEVEKLDGIILESVNWEQNFPYKPFVKVKIAWNSKGFYLIFDVSEKQTLANETNLRGKVCNDSCVEFFISTDDRKSYYNFEFNSIGSIHACYRKSDLSFKKNIEDIDLNKILIYSSFEKFKALNIYNSSWKLKVHIPFSIFNDKNIINQKIYGNFYKCGDLLDTPHYISWNKITSKNPNFHLPQYFGKLEIVV